MDENKGVGESVQSVSEKKGAEESVQMKYILAAIAIAVFVIIGANLYIMSGINEKINSIQTDLNIIRASLTTDQGSNNSLGSAGSQNTNQGQTGTETNNVNIDLTGKTARGNENAKVVIVEFSDFQCPFCGRVQQTIEQILKDYNGSVKLYYKHFPLTQIHPYAQKAAEAAELAADQGKFWEYHDKLFQNQNNLDTESLKRYAAELGLDTNKFNKGLESGEKAAIVNKDLQEGLSLGVQGTPTFFINGRILVGAQPYSAFKQIIDEELKKY
jgi:protein-disulfide isomerase